MPSALINGVRLHYETYGQGVPLVFVHEFAGDQRSWDPQVRFFARRYQVITYNADRKSTRLNSSHLVISYAVFCLTKKTRHAVDRGDHIAFRLGFRLESQGIAERARGGHGACPG